MTRLHSMTIWHPHPVPLGCLTTYRDIHKIHGIVKNCLRHQAKIYPKQLHFSQHLNLSLWTSGTQNNQMSQTFQPSSQKILYSPPTLTSHTAMAWRGEEVFPRSQLVNCISESSTLWLLGISSSSQAISPCSLYSGSSHPPLIPHMHDALFCL